LAALGEMHPNYATTLNDLGVLYVATGEHAKAEPLFRQAAAICRVAYDAADEHTISSLKNLIGAIEHGARRASSARISPRAGRPVRKS